jgi:hypothetical protein
MRDQLSPREGVGRMSCYAYLHYPWTEIASNTCGYSLSHVMSCMFSLILLYWTIISHLRIGYNRN